MHQIYEFSLLVSLSCSLDERLTDHKIRDGPVERPMTMSIMSIDHSDGSCEML